MTLSEKQLVGMRNIHAYVLAKSINIAFLLQKYYYITRPLETYLTILVCNDEEIKMKNAGKVIFLVTLISVATKLLSFLGNIIIPLSIFGGKNIQLDIFNYAMTIPTLIFTSIGTALTTIIIPIYSSLLVKKDKTRAKKFIDDILNISAVLVIILIAICYFLAPTIVNFTKYKDNLEEFKFAVFAIRTLLPVMFFFCFNYIFTGFLQANNRFKMAATVSLPSSLVTIIYLYFFADKYGITGLVFVSLFGFALQPIILIPSMKKTGYKYKFSFDYKSKDIKESAKLIPSVLLGVSAHQVNMFFNSTLSTYFNTISLINSVQNLMLTPVLMVVSSISSVYYPKLSSSFGSGNITEYKKDMEKVIGVFAFLFIPASFGLVLLRHNVIELIRWGAFGTESGIIAENILGFYSMGIFFVGLKEILDKAMYAQKSTTPSAIVGIIITIVNVSFSLILRKPFGTYCLPIAYSISFFIGSIVLFFMFNKKVNGIDKKTYTGLLKCLVSAVIMSLVVYFVNSWSQNLYFGKEIITRLLKLIIPTFSGLMFYFIATYVLKVEQSRFFFDKVLKRNERS